jgi:hypothetical protein
MKAALAVYVFGVVLDTAILNASSAVHEDTASNSSVASARGPQNSVMFSCFLTKRNATYAVVLCISNSVFFHPARLMCRESIFFHVAAALCGGLSDIWSLGLLIS